ncbi:hypothetical protein ALO59_05335 [Pseudomonas amygdali pv. mellea]|nr:hypothetical protein ALO51_05258 [Pseudomonas amygdali]KPX78264.1 hypothetical protein ALO59_05335 [Pseudomonas amygdali pv. mellea]
MPISDGSVQAKIKAVSLRDLPVSRCANHRKNSAQAI